MQKSIVLKDLKNPEEVKRLTTYLREAFRDLDPVYTESAPNGSITAARGRLAIYKNGSDYETWQNVDGGTTWQRVDPGAINSVPSGAIILWHGTIANIPSGYVICDGNNSTPNLLAKFVRGVATAATNPGTTGGTDTNTHTVTVAGHALLLTEIPAHGHVVKHGTGGGTGLPTGFTVPDGTTVYTSENAGGGGSHGHTGSSVDTVDNKPAYYAVAFIMKT